jgi:Zn-dependent protease
MTSTITTHHSMTAGQAVKRSLRLWFSAVFTLLVPFSFLAPFIPGNFATGVFLGTAVLVLAGMTRTYGKEKTFRGLTVKFKYPLVFLDTKKFNNLFIQISKQKIVAFYGKAARFAIPAALIFGILYMVTGYLATTTWMGLFKNSYGNPINSFMVNEMYNVYNLLMVPVPMGTNWILFVTILLLLLAAIPHELSHAIVGIRHGIKIKSSGIILMGCLLGGAYVDQDEADFKHANLKGSLEFTAAGVLSNLIVAGICLYGLLVTVSYLNPPLSGGVGVLSNQQRVWSFLTSPMQWFYAPTSPNMPWFASSYTAISQNFLTDINASPLATAAIYFFFWGFLSNLSLAIVNSFPAGPFDGGYYFRRALSEQYSFKLPFSSHVVTFGLSQKRQRLVKIVTSGCILLFVMFLFVAPYSWAIVPPIEAAAARFTAMTANLLLTHVAYAAFSYSCILAMLGAYYRLFVSRSTPSRSHLGRQP